MRMKLFAGFFMFFVGVAMCSAKTWTNVQVVRVVDGDTLVCRLGNRTETVQLVGIDTPEIYTDLGHIAREFVIRELKGSRIEVVECGRDRYGRVLALVSYKKPGQRERSLQAVLLTRGLARVMEVQPLPKPLSNAFRDVEAFARRYRLGLWRYLDVKP
jgi:endonuclease YncB( thermonuclease family)